VSPSVSSGPALPGSPHLLCSAYMESIRLLVERRHEVFLYPKARVLTFSTFEIFRGLGLSDEVARVVAHAMNTPPPRDLDSHGAVAEGNDARRAPLWSTRLRRRGWSCSRSGNLCALHRSRKARTPKLRLACPYHVTRPYYVRTYIRLLLEDIHEHAGTAEQGLADRRRSR
jgi:hypothetical protein